LTVVPAKSGHARGIAEVHVRSWQQAYQGLLPSTYLASLSIDERERQWHEILASGNSETLLYLQNQTIVGFLSYGASRDKATNPSAAEIMALYIEPKQWRKGIGKILWSACRNNLAVAGYQTVTLWVMTHNTRGIRFYEAQGFELEEGAIEQSELGGVSFLEQRYTYTIYKKYEITN
jgi:ribosomal protein S18 acetylase RimI-like enzyme